MFVDYLEIDVVICFSDLVVFGMLFGFVEVNVWVGDDVWIVGFDDIEESFFVYF